MLAKVSQILGDPIVAVLPELCMEKHKDRRKHARRGLCAPLPHGVRSFIPTPQPITVFVCVGVAFFSAAAELGTRWKHALAAHTFFLVESPMIIAMNVVTTAMRPVPTQHAAYAMSASVRACDVS